MTNCFHLAIPAGNIKTALGFYCDILGCTTGNQEEGARVTFQKYGFCESNTSHNLQT